MSTATDTRPKLDTSTPKKLVTSLLAGRYGIVRVRRGRGTSQSWIYIKTQHVPHDEVKRLVEQHLYDQGFCGRYWPDWFEPIANVSWEVM